MGRSTGKLTGFRELNQALNELPRGAHSGALRRSGLKAMKPMAELAARLAPNAIHMGPGVDLPRYARALVMEFGSFKDQPQPYMRPAFDQDGNAVLERLKPLLRTEIDKVVARLERQARRRAGG